VFLAFVILSQLSPNVLAELDAGDANERPHLCTITAPLAVGTPAPCTGLLWSIEQSRKALGCASVALPKCALSLNLCGKLRIEDGKEKGALLGICNSRIDKQRNHILELLQPLSWWQNPTFWTVTSSVLTFGVGVYLGVSL